MFPSLGAESQQEWLSCGEIQYSFSFFWLFNWLLVILVTPHGAIHHLVFVISILDCCSNLEYRGSSNLVIDGDLTVS